jgi:hypothetical protein
MYYQKLWKNYFSNEVHGMFLEWRNTTKNLAAHFCPDLVCPQIATVRIQFLPYFWNPLIK